MTYDDLNKRVLNACDALKNVGVNDASPSPTTGYVQVPVREAEQIIARLPRGQRLRSK